MVKKISHKEVRRRMKMDEMAEAKHWLEELWDEQGKRITWGLIAVAVIAVGGYLYWDWQKKSLLEAMNFYSEALVKASQERYDEALPALDAVIQQYGSTPAYRLALILKGDILFTQNKPEEALEHYRKASQKADAHVAPIALLGLAACQESLNREDQAKATYERIIQEFPKAGFQSEARFHMARILERQGRTQKAAELYRQIPKESAWYAQAEQRAQWLSAPVISLSTAESQGAS